MHFLQIFISSYIYFARVTVSRVEITVLPLGSAVLSFTLNWNPKRSLSFLSIEELRTWLFLSKFRNKVFNGFQGWRLNEKMYVMKKGCKNKRKRVIKLVR